MKTATVTLVRFALCIALVAGNYAAPAFAQSESTDIAKIIKKAEQGNAVAQFALGFMYYEGEGVPQNYKEAAKWYILAAEQGRAHAQAALSGMYMQGKGVAKNYTEGLKWGRLAAEQGNTMAQGFLGIMYEYGRGVPQNYREAYIWYSLSAASVPEDGQETAIKNRQSVEEKLTPADIIRAQDEALKRMETIRENQANK